jgi:hypothetical protein
MGQIGKRWASKACAIFFFFLVAGGLLVCVNVPLFLPLMYVTIVGCRRLRSSCDVRYFDHKKSPMLKKKKRNAKKEGVLSLFSTVVMG